MDFRICTLNVYASLTLQKVLKFSPSSTDYRLAVMAALFCLIFLEPAELGDTETPFSWAQLSLSSGVSSKIAKISAPSAPTLCHQKHLQHKRAMSAQPQGFSIHFSRSLHILSCLPNPISVLIRLFGN